jgi:hypothetical protein
VHTVIQRLFTTPTQARINTDCHPCVHGVPRMRPQRFSADASFVPAAVLGRLLLGRRPALVSAAQMRDEVEPLLLADFGHALAELLGRPALLARLLARWARVYGLLGGGAPCDAGSIVGRLGARVGLHAECVRRAWAAGQGWVVCTLVVRVLLARELEAAARERWRRTGDSFAAVCHNLVLVSDTHLELAGWMRSTLMYADAALREPGVLTAVAPALGHAADRMRQRTASAADDRQRRRPWQTRFYRDFIVRNLLRVSALDLLWPDATRGWDAGRLPDLTQLLQYGTLWTETRRRGGELFSAMVHVFASKTTNHACLKRNFVTIVERYCRQFPVFVPLLRRVVCTSLLGLYDYRLDGVHPPFAQRIDVVESWSTATQSTDAFVTWLGSHENTMLYMLREYYVHMLARDRPLLRIIRGRGRYDAFVGCVHRVMDAMRLHHTPRGALALDAGERRATRAGDVGLSDRAVMRATATAADELGPVPAPPTDPVLYMEWRAGRWVDMHRLAGKRHVRPGMTRLGRAALLTAALLTAAGPTPARRQSCRRAVRLYRHVCSSLAGSGRMTGVEPAARAMQEIMLCISFKLRKGSFAEVALQRGDAVLRRLDVDPSLKREQSACYLVAHEPALVGPAWHEAGLVGPALVDLIGRCARLAVSSSTDPARGLPMPAAPCARWFDVRWLHGLGVSRAGVAHVRQLVYDYEIGDAGDNRLAKGLRELRARRRGDFLLFMAYVERFHYYASVRVLRLPAHIIRQQIDALRWRTGTLWWDRPPPQAPVRYYCETCRQWASDAVVAHGPHNVWRWTPPAGSARPTLSLGKPARGMYAHGPIKLLVRPDGTLSCVRRKMHKEVRVDPEQRRLCIVSSTARRQRRMRDMPVLDHFVNDSRRSHSWDGEVRPALEAKLGFAQQLAALDAELGSMLDADRRAFEADAGMQALDAAEREAAWQQHVAEQQRHHDGQRKALVQRQEHQLRGYYQSYVGAVRAARRQYEASKCSRRPALAVNMLGRVLLIGGEMWALCTVCATLASFEPANMGPFGFSCGCHALALARRPPPNPPPPVALSHVHGHPAADEPMRLLGFNRINVPLMAVPEGRWGTDLRAEPVLDDHGDWDAVPQDWSVEQQQLLDRYGVHTNIGRVRKVLGDEFKGLQLSRAAAGIPGGLSALRRCDVTDEQRAAGVVRVRRCAVCNRVEKGGRQRLWPVPVMLDGDDASGREAGSGSYERVRVDDGRLRVALLCQSDLYGVRRMLAGGRVYSWAILSQVICDQRLERRLAP